MHSFEVHSNESACRKKVCLGMEQVHIDAIISESLKFINNCCRVFDSGGKPYSVVSHVNI